MDKMAVPQGLKRKATGNNREGGAKNLEDDDDAAAPVADSGDPKVGNRLDGAQTSSIVPPGDRNADAWAAAAAPFWSAEGADASSFPGDKKTAARAPSTIKKGQEEDSICAPSTSKDGQEEDGARAPSNGEDEDADAAPCAQRRAAAGSTSSAAAILSSQIAEGFGDSSSLLNRLLQCCGLILALFGEKSQAAHVSEKKTCVSQATIHYHIKKPEAEILSMYYSSFRVTLGDGECFYRSFIFSHLEHLLDRNDTVEEDRLLCETEKISSAYESLNWPCDNLHEHCEAFKQLLQKVKSWKSETEVVSYRRMRLLRFFRDYRESEHIFSFLRIASAVHICTHPEFSEFYSTTDGMTLEEYCRSEIIRKRSFADHLAIVALAASLGIQLRVFSLRSLMNQDIYSRGHGEANAVPVVTLLYTGIHYDILYP